MPLQRRKSRLPFGRACRRGARGRPAGWLRKRSGVGRIDPRQAFEDVGGDDLGIFRIEPIMRIAAAMCVTVARSDGDAANLQRCDAERGIDIAGAAALDVACRLDALEQAVEPEIVIEPDAHDEARILQPHYVLRLGLILLGVEVGRHEAGRLDAVAADGLGQAAQIGRRGRRRAMRSCACAGDVARASARARSTGQQAAGAAASP